MKALILFFAITAWFQEEAKPPPPPPPPPLEEILPPAKQAFAEGRFQDVVDILKPGLDAPYWQAVMLSADAYYAIGTPEALRKAKYLYERSLYEDDNIPFDDHSYYQLASIYLRQAQGAEDLGEFDEARFLKDEADFHLSLMLRKYPSSYYAVQAQNQLLDLAMESRDYEKVTDRAFDIWENAIDINLLDKVEPIVFVNLSPFDYSAQQIRDVYNRHREQIRLLPNLVYAYAQRFENAGDPATAGDLYLDIINLWPNHPDHLNAMLRLADLNQQQGYYPPAAFLYARVIELDPNAETAAQAFLKVAQLLETRALPNFTVQDKELTYLEILERIRYSQLDPAVRARYTYQLALLQAGFGNVDQALLIMKNLQDSYQRGPFTALYRRFYETLLITTINRRFEQERYWSLDKIYEQHHDFLAFNNDPSHAMKIAEAYIRLDLPTGAKRVYEDLWNFKQSTSGFELAYEEPLTDYMHLLNVLHDDDRLAIRMPEYERLYGKRDRLWNRYYAIKTLYQSRTMEPEPFLEMVKEEDLTVRTRDDALRMRRIGLMAQELDDTAFAERVYNAAKAWPDLPQQLPILDREADLFMADRIFSLGNYFEARKRYNAILADQRFDDLDRDWAYLQIARLYELEGKVKPSLRIYGQIAYASDPDAEPFIFYAHRRMAAMAARERIAQLKNSNRNGAF